MALRVVSPELVLVDPTLLGEPRDHASGLGGDTTPEETMSDETLHLNGNGNGASLAPAAAAAAAAGTAEQPAAPSLETTLFKAGLITADQLGEVVLERVQSGRPAGDIVVERGLVSREALAEMLAPAAEPAPAQPVDAFAAPAPEPAAVVAVEQLPPPAVESAPAPPPDPVAAPVVEPAFEPAPAPAEPFMPPAAEAYAPPVYVPAPAVESPAFLSEEPATEPEPEPVPETPAPETPAPEASTPETPEAELVATPVEAPAAPEPAEPSVVLPAAPPAAEAPVAAEPEPGPVLPEAVPAPEQQQPVEPVEHGFSMGEVHYGIRIRLAEGVTLDAGSYPSRESAVEAARGIASRFAAESGEWPLVGDTLVRPDAVLAIEIESAVSWFSSKPS